MTKHKSSFCPLIKKDCIEHKCNWYMYVAGHNPNTGEYVNEYGCAVAWMPVLLIENSQQQRQTGAAVESLRNHVVEYQVSSSYAELTENYAKELTE